MKKTTLILKSLGFFMSDGKTFSDAFTDLVRTIWPVVLALTTSAILLLAVWYGWGFWTAGGDEQKKKAAKDKLSNFIIGLVVIFSVAVGGPILMALLETWGVDWGLPS